MYFWDTHLAVDTFFFISGILITYNFLNTMRNSDSTFNIFRFYLHRYLRYNINLCFHKPNKTYYRLTPPLAVLYFFLLTISRRITSGPQYNFLLQTEISKCKANWWAFFLYVQNYVVPTEMVGKKSAQIRR